MPEYTNSWRELAAQSRLIAAELEAAASSHREKAEVYAHLAEAEDKAVQMSGEEEASRG